MGAVLNVLSVVTVHVCTNKWSVSQCYGVCVQCDEIAVDDDDPKK